jgi:hypothetical protein
MKFQARIGFGCGRSNAPGKPEEKKTGVDSFFLVDQRLNG